MKKWPPSEIALYAVQEDKCIYVYFSVKLLNENSFVFILLIHILQRADLESLCNVLSSKLSVFPIIFSSVLALYTPQTDRSNHPHSS